MPLAATVGLVTGLRAEARIARRIGMALEGGGTPDGAAAAAERLVVEGATALVSFGLCGGLDPGLRPGALVVAREVLYRGRRLPTDPALRAALGVGADGALLAAEHIVARAADKWALFKRTGVVAVDLESGAVALVAQRHGLPFAVLRAVCDPAETTLPDVALLALDARGRIGAWRVLAGVAGKPGQIPGLLRLARDAARARSALLHRVHDIGRGGRTML